MPQSDPTLLSVSELSAAIQARRLSPVDLVEAYLARIAEREPKLQAFVEVYAEDARLAAEAADKAIRSGHAVGPLHGVPVLLKDNIDVAGMPTTAGSIALEDSYPATDAPLVTALEAAGAVVLGKRRRRA